MTMTNLPRDLVEEILSRVPGKSIRAVGSTCKTWNLIFKDERFANKHIDKAATATAREKEFLMITAGDSSMVYLFRFNLYENFDVSINHKGISIPRENLRLSDETLFRSQVFLSNGVLICVWANIKSKLLVWNPYWGKKRWIDCPNTYCSYEMFAFGYDRSCGRYKILRFSCDNNMYMEIYDLSFDSWRTLDAASGRNKIDHTVPGLSLKGNTYWYARDSESIDGVLHCFDFTKERFGPRLPLPPCSYSAYNVSLSSVKEEKLAVLYSPWSRGVEIWVTNKIEPYEVSWSKFFKVETMQRIDHGFRSVHFFIDEEKKVIVLFDRSNNACIISGESGHFRKVDLRQYSGPFELVGCIVPSSVQI